MQAIVLASVKGSETDVIKEMLYEKKIMYYVEILLIVILKMNVM